MSEQLSEWCTPPLSGSDLVRMMRSPATLSTVPTCSSSLPTTSICSRIWPSRPRFCCRALAPAAEVAFEPRLVLAAIVVIVAVELAHVPLRARSGNAGLSWRERSDWSRVPARLVAAVRRSRSRVAVAIRGRSRRSSDDSRGPGSPERSARGRARRQSSRASRGCSRARSSRRAANAPRSSFQSRSRPRSSRRDPSRARLVGR